MCELTMALAIGSTIVGGIGSIYQANAASEAQKYNAKVAEMNATLSDRRAKDAIERGAIEEQRKRQQVAQIRGQQTAAAAANGVDISFGSPLDTIVDTAVLGEMDALTIRSNAYRESYDYQVQAVNQRAQAQLSNYNAETTKTAGYLDAFGTILGGVGKAYKSQKTPSIGAFA